MYLKLKTSIGIALIGLIIVNTYLVPSLSHPLIVTRRNITLKGYSITGNYLTAILQIGPGPSLQILIAVFQEGKGWLGSVKLPLGPSNKPSSVKVSLKLTCPPPPNAKLCIYVKEGFLWKLIIKVPLIIGKVGPLPVPYFNAGGNNWTLICCIAMAISYYGFLSHPWEVASVLGKKYSEDANLREVKEYVESFYGRYLGFSLAKFPDLREAIQYMYLNLRSSVPIISSFKRVKGKALMIIGMDGASRLYVLDPSSPPGKPPLKLMTKFPPGPVYLISLKPRGIKPKPPKATLQLWINLIDKYGNWFKSVWDGEQPYGGCPLLPKGIGWEFKGKWSCPYLRGFPYLIFSGYAYGQDGNYQLYIEIYNAYTYKLVCRDKEGITVRNGVGYVNLRINPPPYPMPQAPYLVKVKLLKGGNTCDEFWFLFYAYGN